MSTRDAQKNSRAALLQMVQTTTTIGSPRKLIAKTPEAQIMDKKVLSETTKKQKMSTARKSQLQQDKPPKVIRTRYGRIVKVPERF